MPPSVSVLMPTYKQEAFIRRALDSLQAQTLAGWELIIVDDGSPDTTREALAPYLDDPRITYHRFPANRGLGAALNFALDRAQAPLVAYLPSDDVYYAEHLASLKAVLDEYPDAALAYSGVRHHYNRTAPGQIDDTPLQLVQVMHRRTPDRWIERAELESDDLDRLFWRKLRARGAFLHTGEISCEWVMHPTQRSEIMREPFGGINRFRRYYAVQEPLRYHTRGGNYADEPGRYRRFRERPDTPPAPDGLKILLVGELAYNAERVLALEERGHRLYGLWIEDPQWFNTVGPLPFGHVTDLPREHWRDAIRELQPDVIYALLNWQAVPFSRQVREAVPDIPFVWHFKEGPFICLEKGTWPDLLDLYRTADGRIYTNPEVRDWFLTVAPDLEAAGHSLILDGDLPKRDWFVGERTPLLSERDGEIHTVVPGRPIGLHAHVMGELAEQGIHVHVYGDFTQDQWRSWVAKVQALTPNHLHLHPNVDQENWLAEFSQYDAGWLHYFTSDNHGEMRRAVWDDLNYPARIATYAQVGIPMILGANPGHIVATENLLRQRDLGVLFADIPDLGAQLRDTTRMAALRENIWAHRHEYTFDYHAGRLVAFFREVIASKRGACSRSGT